MRARSCALVFALLAGAAGCSSDTLPLEDKDRGPDGGPADAGADGALAPPIVDPTASETAYASVPLRGSASGAVLVLIEGGRQPVTADVGQDGRFCADVPLNTDAANSLSVSAQSPFGKLSPPTLVAIRHSSDFVAPGDPDDVQAAPSDVALGRPVEAGQGPSEGANASLVDGNIDSYVRYDFWDQDFFGRSRDSNAWATISLGGLYELTKIVVSFPQSSASSHDYALDYVVLISDLPSPEEPSLGSDQWIKVGDQTDGDGTPDEWAVDAGTTARFAAVLVFEDDNSDPDQREEVKVGEVEVWGVSTDVATAAPAIPTCGR